MSADWDPRSRFPAAPLETPWIHVKRGAIGSGVFAKVRIPAGQPILRFEGQEISFEEAVARGDWEGHTLQVGKGRYIDPEPPGVYANHSCDPNSGLKNGGLVALRDILPGEEVVWDYSTSMAEDFFELDCQCGAAACRGRIRDFKHLPDDVRARYLRLGVVPDFVRSA